ncbi:hypothetical protein BSQ98_25760 [Serratia liquefaciens]|uniref:transposase family protein n=1 Tax=Serratia TaxID=613 RepID=UPI00101F79E7|nr:transposase family protein [Serratia liquefaciens]RYM57483.1 hypothetical protein BSQ98_25760 [Serratia liquefaciens]
MSIFSYFFVIPDPRKDVNIKHNLFDVLFLVLAAVLSGEDIQAFGDAHSTGYENIAHLKMAYHEQDGIPL